MLSFYGADNFSLFFVEIVIIIFETENSRCPQNCNYDSKLIDKNFILVEFDVLTNLICFNDNFFTTLELFVIHYEVLYYIFVI